MARKAMWQILKVHAGDGMIGFMKIYMKILWRDEDDSDKRRD